MNKVMKLESSLIMEDPVKTVVSETMKGAQNVTINVNINQDSRQLDASQNRVKSVASESTVLSRPGRALNQEWRVVSKELIGALALLHDQFPDVSLVDINRAFVGALLSTGISRREVAKIAGINPTTVNQVDSALAETISK